MSFPSGDRRIRTKDIGFTRTDDKLSWQGWGRWMNNCCRITNFTLAGLTFVCPDDTCLPCTQITYHTYFGSVRRGHFDPGWVSTPPMTWLLCRSNSAFFSLRLCWVCLYPLESAQSHLSRATLEGGLFCQKVKTAKTYVAGHHQSGLLGTESKKRRDFANGLIHFSWKLLSCNFSWWPMYVHSIY